MKSFSVFVIVLIASLVASQATAKDAKEQIDPSGTWRWEYDWQGETIKDALRLNIGMDGNVVGTFYGRNNTAELKKGTIKEDNLELSVPVEFQGTELVLNFSGRIKNDEIDGNVIIEVNGETREFPWKPTRNVKMEDVVGAWQIRIETPDGNVLEPTMKIATDGDKYTAEYTSMQGRELEVKDLRVEKNYLMYTITAEFDGNSFQVDYTGRPYGDKMKGKLKYDFGGNTGEGEFVANRKVEKKNNEP